MIFVVTYCINSIWMLNIKISNFVNKVYFLRKSMDIWWLHTFSSMLLCLSFWLSDNAAQVYKNQVFKAHEENIENKPDDKYDDDDFAR